MANRPVDHPALDRELLGLAITETYERLKFLHSTSAAARASGEHHNVAALEQAIADVDRALEEVEVLSDEIALQAVTLAESERRFSNLFQLIPDGVVETDDRGRIVSANVEATTQLGVASATLVGKPFVVFIATEDRHRFDSACASLPATGHVTLDVTMRPRERLSFRASMHVARIGVAQDATSLLIAIRDVSSDHRLRDRLVFSASHDDLTGIANRATFFEHVERVLELASTSDAGVTIFYVDIDRLKTTNDTLGHEAGDELLKSVARRLQTLAPAGAMVARLGGDEFAICCAGTHEPPDAMALARRIVAELAEAAPFQQHSSARAPTTVRASVGVAVTTGSDRSADEIVNEADFAMYTAKKRGGNQCALFDESAGQLFRKRDHSQDGLRVAVDRGELELYYQPEFDLTDGRIAGLEALVRWNHPEHGVIGAEEFIPYAEQIGLINRIGQWVIEEACRHAGAWTAAGPFAGSVSVNLSPLQLEEPDIVAFVRDALDRHRLEPAGLCLELTEGFSITRSDVMLGRLEELHDLGVRLAIDDFGTRYAAFEYLRSIPADVIKIDGVFTAGLGVANVDDHIVATIVRLADALGLVAVAEGVDDERQLTVLRSLGCPLAQGYLLARPAPERAVAQLVADDWRIPL